MINLSIHKPSEAGTILVTGGTGFLGAYIIRDLVNAGYSVRAIRRKNNVPFFISPAIFSKVEWLNGDILDIPGLEEAMDGVDAVIHSAAKVSFQNKERAEMMTTNIDGTTNVVNTAIEKNVSRFIHVSSVAALGRNQDGLIVNENRKWEDNRANTHYAISKYYAEMEVWRGIAEGLNAVIVNPGTILGYGDWNESSSAIFKNVYKGFPWYTNGITGFVDVEDVARATIHLLKTDISAERFILTGGNWSYRRVFDAIADGFTKKRPHRQATPFLGGIAWRAERLKTLLTGKKSLLSRESARVAHSVTNFDNSKILRTLPGFAFTPLEQTINRACSQYAVNLQRL